VRDGIREEGGLKPPLHAGNPAKSGATAPTLLFGVSRLLRDYLREGAEETVYDCGDSGIRGWGIAPARPAVFIRGSRVLFHAGPLPFPVGREGARGESFGDGSGIQGMLGEGVSSVRGVRSLAEGFLRAHRSFQ